jgi:hypothetical protein
MGGADRMRTDLTQLVKANFDGLNFLNMGPNSIWWSDLSPVQFVPAGQILPSKYHTKNRRQYWFSEQISNWIQQTNYFNPWQATDVLPLQFITNGLTPVSVKLYKCDGTLISTTAMTNVTSPAMVAGQLLWQGTIDLTPCAGANNDSYYLDVIAGAGGAAAEIISEGLHIKDDWPNTVLFECTSSQNKQTMVFDTGFQIVHRVKGFFDNMFKPKYKGAFYVDEPQDISILNAIQYETTTLIIDGGEGIPDYETRKIAGFLLLDGCMIEGEAYSLNEGAEWEEIFTPGAPKKMQKIEIRPASTQNATGATASGADLDASMIITTDATYFGPNDGSVSGSNEIIQALIS